MSEADYFECGGTVTLFLSQVKAWIRSAAQLLEQGLRGWKAKSAA